MTREMILTVELRRPYRNAVFASGSLAIDGVRADLSEEEVWRILWGSETTREDMSLEAVERAHVARVLATRGDTPYYEIAERLGIQRKTLQNYRKKWDL